MNEEEKEALAAEAEAAEREAYIQAESDLVRKGYQVLFNAVKAQHEGNHPELSYLSQHQRGPIIIRP